MGTEIDPRTLTPDAAIDIITQLVVSQGWLGIAVEYVGPGPNWTVSLKERANAQNRH